METLSEPPAGRSSVYREAPPVAPSRPVPHASIAQAPHAPLESWHNWSLSAEEFFGPGSLLVL